MKLAAGLLFLLAVLSFFFNTGKNPELPDEPADPDDSKTLDKRSASEVINQGKQLIYEIAKY